VICLKSLIIAKPLVLNKNQLGKIITAIEEKNLKIIGSKEMLLDVCNYKKRLAKETDPTKRKVLEEQLRVPCILIAVEGNEAISAGKELAQAFGELLHVSSSQEIAKYELNRFFKKQELMSFEKVLDWV